MVSILLHLGPYQIPFRAGRHLSWHLGIPETRLLESSTKVLIGRMGMQTTETLPTDYGCPVHTTHDL